MKSDCILAAVSELTAERKRSARAEFDELVQRAEGGSSSAMYSVAFCLQQADGVTRDEHEASVWYTKAAARSNVMAMNNLGVYYGKQGEHVEARRWYEKAAEAGDGLAMKNLGWQLLEGVGVPKDLDAARVRLERAEELGCIGANLPLAKVLREMDPVGNAYRCAELQRESAEHGDCAESAHEWALSLWSGTGVQADSQAAERWMCTAASRGHREAREWLMLYGTSWIAEWAWAPQVSLGPLTFGQSQDHLVDALALEEVEGDDEEEHASRDLKSKLYGLELGREKGLLCSISTGLDADIVIQYRNVNLLGASLKEALSVLDATDWKVEDLAVFDADVSSDSLGISLDVRDHRVELLGFSTPWDSDEEFRVSPA